MNKEYEVYLRPLRLSDAAISYRWRNNPVVWLNTGSAPDRVITEEMETDWLRTALANPSSKRYAICLKADDRYIGNAYLSNISNGTAEEQIFIGDVTLWGHGIGTAARKALYEVAEHELGISRIVSNIRVRNIASLKSVRKLGFAELMRDAEWIRLGKLMGANAQRGYDDECC